MENNKGIRIKKNRLEEKLQTLEKWMNEKEPGIKIIRKDFNARTRKKRGGVTDMGKEELEENGKQLRNRKGSRKGKLLINFIEKREVILNGNTKEDEEGEYITGIRSSGRDRMYSNRLHIRG